MKRLWVALLFLGVALVLFIGTPALSKGPLDNIPQSLDALQESIFNFQWTLLNGRFTDNGDGTVRDNLTGLVWMKNANLGRLTWDAACDECATLSDTTSGDLTDGSVAGDWRLPNVRELHSLVDYGKNVPALPSGHPFVVDSSVYGYWSSTTHDDLSGVAWYVSFETGQVLSYAKSDISNVWCVRGGQ